MAVILYFSDKEMYGCMPDLGVEPNRVETTDNINIFHMDHRGIEKSCKNIPDSDQGPFTGKSARS